MFCQLWSKTGVILGVPDTELDLKDCAAFRALSCKGVIGDVSTVMLAFSYLYLYLPQCLPSVFVSAAT